MVSFWHAGPASQKQPCPTIAQASHSQSGLGGWALKLELSSAQFSSLELTTDLVLVLLDLTRKENEVLLHCTAALRNQHGWPSCTHCHPRPNRIPKLGFQVPGSLRQLHRGRKLLQLPVSDSMHHLIFQHIAVAGASRSCHSPDWSPTNLTLGKRESWRVTALLACGRSVCSSVASTAFQDCDSYIVISP